MHAAAAAAAHAHRQALFAGTAFALAAGLMWGLVFVVPVMLPEYPAMVLSFARYLAFGLIALPLAWLDRAALAELTRADWVEALKLALIGNLLYYLFLAAAIQRAGAPLPTMIIGTLPVVIAISSNLRDHARDGKLPWARLAPSLVLIALGIAAVNQAELAQHAQGVAAGPGASAPLDLGSYALGALLAVGAVACWTWYPLRNADWLRAHASRSPRTWATAQGVATLPLAAVGFAAYWVYSALGGGVLDGALGALPAGPAETTAGAVAAFEMPFGPRPWFFLGLMFAVGLFASWLGTLCWNEASQRLPTTLSGQLIVFETLAALAYAYALRGAAPGWLALGGIALLVTGVAWALRSPPGRPSAGPPVEPGAAR